MSGELFTDDAGKVVVPCSSLHCKKPRVGAIPGRYWPMCREHAIEYVERMVDFARKERKDLLTHLNLEANDD